MLNFVFCDFYLMENFRSKRLQMQLVKAPTIFFIKHINLSMIWPKRRAKVWTRWAPQQSKSGTCSIGRIFFDIFNTTSSNAIENDTTKTKSNDLNANNAAAAETSTTTPPPTNGSSKLWANGPLFVIFGHSLWLIFRVSLTPPAQCFGLSLTGWNNWTSSSPSFIVIIIIILDFHENLEYKSFAHTIANKQHIRTSTSFHSVVIEKWKQDHQLVRMKNDYGTNLQLKSSVRGS